MLKSTIRKAAFTYLEGRGYNMHALSEFQMQSVRRFYEAEQEAKRRYNAFSPQYRLELSAALEARYRAEPLFGKSRVYDLIAKLATVINPLEPALGCVSQLTHELQVATEMEQDGMSEKLVLCALIHDLGTLLLLTGEEAMHVEAGGKKVPLIGTRGGGLHGCTFRWDHGDFIYLRLKDYVPADIAWLVRHHSMDAADCMPYMSEEDQRFYRELFLPFAYYDDRKDMYRIPNKRLEDYRDLIERAFPNEIVF